MDSVYRDICCIPGMKCTYDGKFMYNGKRKKIIFASKNFGNEKATARLTWRENGRTLYMGAAKAVALAWLPRYNPNEDYLIYKDGDIHNISAGNLVVLSHDDYYRYTMRNTWHEADSIEKRKRKLQLVIEEATMTKNYFETLDMSPINKHVEEYLYMCLMKYCKETLFLGDMTALNIVPEAIARMYECIMNGMCLYNYERYCKKILLNYKKNKSFGFTGKVPKRIEINIDKLNLDCLWERYKKIKSKSRM